MPRLLEAIIDANHRALGGDASAGLHPAEFAESLPLVALTCIDARLNPLMPEVLGIPEDQFIWLRNAGNIVTGSMSSTMRSLALACAVKGGREVAIIGHTDCLVGKTTTMQLLERFHDIGVERNMLPDNLTEFFGIFGSERQNVIKGVDLVRQSPLIGPKVPVHGLLVDISSGRLEWLVNGYEAPQTLRQKWNAAVQSAEQTVGSLGALTDFKIGDVNLAQTKIGDIVSKAEQWAAGKLHSLEVKTPTTPPAPAPGRASPAQPSTAPPRIPLPPPLRPKFIVRKPRR